MGEGGGTEGDQKVMARRDPIKTRKTGGSPFSGQESFMVGSFRESRPGGVVQSQVVPGSQKEKRSTTSLFGDGEIARLRVDGVESKNVKGHASLGVQGAGE